MSDKGDGNIIIQLMENGPLIVKGLKTLRDAQGNLVEMKKDTIALCRCGGSQNKPFCDGAHKMNGFSSKREISKPLDREKVYQGKEVAINDNRTICAHAETCVKELSSVFNIEAHPWINPDGATVADIINLVKKCPSGALSYSIAGKTVRNFERAPAIDIAANGPYNITGGIELKSDLVPPSTEHYSLCRCGASKNKPFCDGAHHETGFEG